MILCDSISLKKIFSEVQLIHTVLIHIIVIHTVKGFGIVNKAERDVFLELSCFLMIQWMLAI